MPTIVVFHFVLIYPSYSFQSFLVYTNFFLEWVVGRAPSAQICRISQMYLNKFSQMFWLWKRFSNWFVSINFIRLSRTLLGVFRAFSRVHPVFRRALIAFGSCP